MSDLPVSDPQLVIWRYAIPTAANPFPLDLPIGAACRGVEQHPLDGGPAHLEFEIPDPKAPVERRWFVIDAATLTGGDQDDDSWEHLAIANLGRVRVPLLELNAHFITDGEGPRT